MSTPARRPPREPHTSEAGADGAVIQIELLQALLPLDHELALGDGDTYRRLLRDDAVVIVPGQVLDRDATVEAMNASPGWDEVAFADPQLVTLGEDAAAITYRFRGRRGTDMVYEAQMTSAWSRENGGWRMAVHQQTPLASG